MVRGRNQWVRSQIISYLSVQEKSMSKEQCERFIKTGSLEGVSEEPPPEPYNPDVVKGLAEGRLSC